MHIPGEQDERRAGVPVIYGIAGISAFILLILVVVIINNRKPAAPNIENRPAVENVSGGAAFTETENASGTVAANGDPEAENLGTEIAERISSGDAYIDQLYNEGILSPDDLDFWSRYPQQEDVTIQNPDVAPESPVTSPTPSPTPSDPSEDGKHTFVSRSDGTSDWVQINSYITKNTYDPMKLILKGDRLGYYEGQRQASYFGVDISKYNGKVDFAKLKNDGVDFAMIRLGARGYGSGQILPDENFETNIAAANEAGLNVGVYFFSQAITVEEAVEEAAFVVQHLTNRKVTYPVAFDMEYISNDVSRIDSLKKDAKTEIAVAFMNHVRTAGYLPILYGTKEWLIEQIDLTKLQDYDIWLSQQAELPDYPYKYQMWQYSLTGRAAGIEGNVDFNISFIDYASKY